MEKKRIDCYKCKHFYVTWDQSFPRGCKAMGFKSKEMPSDVVFQSSGMECMRFEEKEID
ncbi:MAG: uracil-DNA glycosylase [Nitrospirota bacterium]